MKCYSIIVCLFLCLTGCINDNIRHSEKDSVSSERSSHYPESRYLTAKGYGESKSSARFRAKAEISNIFESTITSQLTLETRAFKNSLKGSYYSEKIDAKIRVCSQITLKGLQVIDLRTENGQFAALAVLDKSQARGRWLQEIRNFDDKIQAEYNNIQNRHNKLRWIKPLQKIWNYWMERSAFASRLSIINCEAPSNKFGLKKILGMISTIKNSLQLHVRISGTYGKKVTDTIAKALNNLDYIVCDSRKANTIVSGNIVVEPDIKNKDWIFRRAIVSIQIIDRSTNNQVFSIAEDVRSGHLTLKAAINKSIKAISTVVQKQIMNIFDPLHLL